MANGTPESKRALCGLEVTKSRCDRGAPGDQVAKYPTSRRRSEKHQVTGRVTLIQGRQVPLGAE